MDKVGVMGWPSREVMCTCSCLRRTETPCNPGTPPITPLTDESLDVVRDLDSDIADELLYGRAGYLYALLFLSAQTEDDIGAELVDPRLERKVVESILHSGRRLAASKRSVIVFFLVFLLLKLL